MSLNDNDVIFIERFLQAFKIIGGNELGFIDYKDFQTLFLQKAGTEGKTILTLINQEDHIREGKLDFISLCFSILTIKTVFNSFSLQNGKISLGSSRINSQTFTRTKGLNAAKVQPGTSNSNCETTASEVPFEKSIKGLLFNIKEDLLGYRYQLELLEASVVEIFAKGIISDQFCKIPIEILVFQDNKKKMFVTCSSIINEEGYCCVKFNLKKGKYILIPMLLKWNVNSYISPENNLDSFAEIDGESNYDFTPLCKNSLKFVFEAIDLDGNGLLNQTEFDLFIRHTSGETASEEWTTVEDNFKMNGDQLTFEGFLELYKLVLQSDPPDMLNMFQRMGMDNDFEFKNSQPFTLVVKSETAKFNIKPLPVASYLDVAEKTVKKITVEQGVSSKIKNMNDLFLFKHKLPHRTTFVIQNQSHSKMAVQLDCSKSVNCESHKKNLNHTFEIQSRSSIIGHHLFPVNVTTDWNVYCKESLK